MIKPFAGILLAMTISACLVCVAEAAESGRFRLIENHRHEFTVMDHAGAKVTAGPMHGTATVVRSSGGLFEEGEHYVSTCLVYARRSREGLDLESACKFTNNARETFYALARRRAGDVESGGGGKGVQKLVGGTGKYSGLTGECPYTSRYLPGNWIVSTGDCTWSRH